jgi:RecA/RadA recombinase
MTAATKPEPSLASVVRALRRGLTTEVEFLRRPSARVPELELAAGRLVGQPGAGRWHYQFETGEGAAGRGLDQDATLVSASTTVHASVVELSGTAVVVEVRQPLFATDGWRLVFRPGMLLERLDEAIGRCLDDQAFCAETALRSLGVRPSGRLPLDGPTAEAAGLNDSQRRAIATACARNLTSIWGPPGTGKTKVIGHLVAALSRAGERVLLAANTNAAVDNAVEAVRAAGVAVHRMHGRGEKPPGETEEQRRLALRRAQAHQCRQLVNHLNEVPRQQSLLFGATPPLVRPGQLSQVFPGREEALARLSRPALTACLKLRLERLEALVRGYEGREPGRAGLPRAMVVAATLTGTYTLESLARERFDTVVIDEASMAGLPSIFCCAGMARKRAIFVGDPRQLPPITECSDHVVRATLGRTVFDLAAHEGSVMLDTQYRMHPSIGGLVSDLFYEGRLESAAPGAGVLGTVESEPFAGSPVVVVDLGQSGHLCERDGRSSRLNRTSAAAAVRLATSAARSGAQVAVITPYAAQARLIRSMTRGEGITCATVHRFQGSESDVVIIDLVDAAPLRPGALLDDPSPGSAARALLNVSVSRAKAKLIVLADLRYFREQGAGPVVELLKAIEARGLVA